MPSVMLRGDSLCFGVSRQTVENVATDVQVERIARRPVQEVGGLDQFWPQRVKQNVWGFSLPVVALWQGPVLSPDGVEESVGANGLLHVSCQHLRRKKTTSNLVFYAQSTMTVISGRRKKQHERRIM